MIEILPVTDEAAWEAARRIRTVVFIEEQACPPEEEWDAFDATSVHVVAWLDGEPVGTARWRTVGAGAQAAAKLERFAVLPAYRGRGIGRRLVAHLMREARAAGHVRLILHAQAYLEAFYREFGFRPVGERFSEVGIPHVKMVWEGWAGG